MVDDIHKVGAFGDFLSLDSTYRHMREQSQPELLDRRVREEWQARGATDLLRALPGQGPRDARDYQPEPLDADVVRRACAPSSRRPTGEVGVAEPSPAPGAAGSTRETTARGDR